MTSEGKTIYTIARIDGDYAILKEDKTGEELFLAMALLPPGADLYDKVGSISGELSLL